jgi:hypothetical protein
MSQNTPAVRNPCGATIAPSTSLNFNFTGADELTRGPRINRENGCEPSSESGIGIFGLRGQGTALASRWRQLRQRIVPTAQPKRRHAAAVQNDSGVTTANEFAPFFRA